ncbi:MAG: hypothetical protein ABSE47_12985 [Acidimicrobiales bacterium]|jgi:hypothetical protein
MEIILSVTVSPSGQLSGTARLATGEAEVVFTGAMELVARIEALCERAANGKEAQQ